MSLHTSDEWLRQNQFRRRSVDRCGCALPHGRDQCGGWFMMLSSQHESGVLAMPLLDKPDVTAEAADCHESCEPVALAEGVFDMAACLAQVRSRDEDAARTLMDRL